jgi:predicted NodU family carbamoyl transferase
MKDETDALMCLGANISKNKESKAKQNEESKHHDNQMEVNENQDEPPLREWVGMAHTPFEWDKKIFLCRHHACHAWVSARKREEGTVEPEVPNGGGHPTMQCC